MKFQSCVTATLAASASALPGMSEMREQMGEIHERNAEADPDGILGPLGDALPGNGLGGAIDGLLGSVAKGTLSPENIRPEPGFTFKAPGPNDSRGPCPGLNLLANYG